MCVCRDYLGRACKTSSSINVVGAPSICSLVMAPGAQIHTRDWGVRSASSHVNIMHNGPISQTVISVVQDNTMVAARSAPLPHKNHFTFTINWKKWSGGPVLLQVGREPTKCVILE